MKKIFIPAMGFLIALISIYSCKKDAKAPGIIGSYTIKAIARVNSDGSSTNEQIISCDTNNTVIFSANGGYTETIGCNASSEIGNWTMNKDTLTIKNEEDGGIFSKGLITNLTSTGFVIDENATGFAKDRVTLVKQ